MQQLSRIRRIRFIAIASISACILLLWLAIAPVLSNSEPSLSDTFEQVLAWTHRRKMSEHIEELTTCDKGQGETSLQAITAAVMIAASKK